MNKAVFVASMLFATSTAAQTYVTMDNFRCIADQCSSASAAQVIEMARFCDNVVTLVSRSGYDVGRVTECAFLSFPNLGFVVDTDAFSGFYINPRADGFSITLANMDASTLRLNAQCLFLDRSGRLTFERAGVQRCN